jgi:hypothetical protein
MYFPVYWFVKPELCCDDGQHIHVDRDLMGRAQVLNDLQEYTMKTTYFGILIFL